MPCQMKRCVANMCSGHYIVMTTARAVSDDIGNVLHRNVRADFWLFSRSQKWQIWLEILKKVRFFRLFVAIVPEESRKSEKTTSENRPIVTGLTPTLVNGDRTPEHLFSILYDAHTETSSHYEALRRWKWWSDRQRSFHSGTTGSRQYFLNSARNSKSTVS